MAEIDLTVIIGSIISSITTIIVALINLNAMRKEKDVDKKIKKKKKVISKEKNVFKDNQFLKNEDIWIISIITLIVLAVVLGTRFYVILWNVFFIIPFLTIIIAFLFPINPLKTSIIIFNIHFFNIYIYIFGEQLMLYDNWDALWNLNSLFGTSTPVIIGNILAVWMICRRRIMLMK